MSKGLGADLVSASDSSGSSQDSLMAAVSSMSEVGSSVVLGGAVRVQADAASVVSAATNLGRQMPSDAIRSTVNVCHLVYSLMGFCLHALSNIQPSLENDRKNAANQVHSALAPTAPSSSHAGGMQFHAVAGVPVSVESWAPRAGQSAAKSRQEYSEKVSGLLDLDAQSKQLNRAEEKLGEFSGKLRGLSKALQDVLQASDSRGVFRNAAHWSWWQQRFHQLRHTSNQSESALVLKATNRRLSRYTNRYADSLLDALTLLNHLKTRLPDQPNLIQVQDQSLSDAFEKYRGLVSQRDLQRVLDGFQSVLDQLIGVSGSPAVGSWSEVNTQGQGPTDVMQASFPLAASASERLSEHVISRLLADSQAFLPSVEGEGAVEREVSQAPSSVSKLLAGSYQGSSGQSDVEFINAALTQALSTWSVSASDTSSEEKKA